MPPDIRERQGSFFTPQIWVEKAQETIADVLGEDWQDDHYVWDCAAGTGNLLAGLDPKAKYRVWASTLQKGDVDIIRERIRNGAALLDSHVFQFDFLNDDFSKLPDGLREIVEDPVSRILESDAGFVFATGSHLALIPCFGIWRVDEDGRRD